jgi:acetoin utilization deacetylase AcuC-like enzyme
LVEEHESVLPECFRIPTKLNNSGKTKEPKDVFARPGYYSFDMSSGISKDTWPSVLASANLAVGAVKHITIPPVQDGERTEKGKTVLALCRPPGHHCNTLMAGGYCYVNNIVVAVDAIRAHHATTAAEEKNEPGIVILDIDFHHGNGTQDAFYSDSSVLYLSIHGQDEYPYYSGYEDELGEGEGFGFNCNFPLPTGSSFEQYLEKLKQALGELETFRPEYLLVSLGFDTFHLDPIGNFKIETEDYGVMAKTIRGSNGVRALPCAILLEGGYVVDRLGANLLSFLDGWESGVSENP